MTDEIQDLYLELVRIRILMDEDIPKAKQILTNLLKTRFRVERRKRE